MNLKKFIISSDTQISFVLKKGTEEVLSQRYDPDSQGRIEIDMRDVVHAQLSFDFRGSAVRTYEQTNLHAEFTAEIDGQAVNFHAVRGGVDNLADTATNFLTQNWLTWQPTVKPVTYYTPEFLTYYAPVAGVVKLRGYFVGDDGQVTSQKDIELCNVEAEKAYTIPVEYQVVVSLLYPDGKPGYYDVWVENASGERLTYIQRYYADAMRSISEDWVLFENSLGGVDCFRAYGKTNLEADHTHNLAEVDEMSEEYRVDTERKYEKNTGHLSKDEARWLLDFFPSQKKYIYVGSYLRQIVVVESNVTGNLRELPTNYTFTYKYADARPLLNLPRTDVPADMLDITIPEVGNFTIPPRLAEVPRLPLSEGDLFPVQNPYSETWSTTTAGALAEVVGQLLAAAAGTGGGVGHTHKNIDLLNLLSYVEEYLLVNGKKIKAGQADLVELARRLETVDFNKGASGVGVYQDGQGAWHIETDYLDVRMKFTATTVEIQKVYHIGGAQIKSAAAMKCVRVEELEAVYRCYMNTVDDDGNQVTNDFRVNDQAYVNTFNLVKQSDGKIGNHFLWRLVTSVGPDYIDLSKSICAEQSDAPIANDDIVLLGYQGTDNPDRQVAVIDAGAGEGAPYYRQFVGINSFSLPAPETQLKPGDNELSGRFHIGQGSTGWKNMDGLPEEIQAAADLAQQAQDDINNAAVGSVNLLLNSGFTGNYETEDMDGDKQLDEETELYSKALLNWSGMATVQEDAGATSGRSATIGSLSQSVTLIPNEVYVISYKAKGTSLAVSCGDYSVSQPVTAEYQRYTHKFTFTGAGVFLISGSATVCDLQLERGTIATDWKPSILDNDKTNAKFQTIQYLYNAMKDGSVDVLGGLVLATMIMVGNYKDGVLQKVTAGISGIYNDDDDVFTWGGGTMEQAIYTVMKYKENPQYVPTEEELLNMAKVVITHGGRAILNDVIVRGYIYALGGLFKGKVEIASGKILLNEDGSGQLANGSVKWDAEGNVRVYGKYESSVGGDRIIIDPGNNSFPDFSWPSIQIKNKNDKEIISIIGFSGLGDNPSYTPEIIMKDPNNEYKSASYSIERMVVNEKIDGNNYQTYIGAGHIYIAKNSEIVWEQKQY